MQFWSLLIYTSRGHRCGFYSKLIFVESNPLKQAHSKLCNCFSNAAIGKNEQIENCNGGRAKYIAWRPKTLTPRGLLPCLSNFVDRKNGGKRFLVKKAAHRFSGHGTRPK